MCESGEVSVDELLVEVHSGGIRGWGKRGIPVVMAKRMHRVFERAAVSCGLMLHHRAPNQLRGEGGSWPLLPAARRRGGRFDGPPAVVLRRRKRAARSRSSAERATTGRLAWRRTS